MRFKRNYSSLMEIYDSNVFTTLKDTSVRIEQDYALAIVNEALRLFSVLSFGLPTLTIRIVSFN